jgi:hypothetical protein
VSVLEAQLRLSLRAAKLGVSFKKLARFPIRTIHELLSEMESDVDRVDYAADTELQDATDYSQGLSP